MCCVELSENVNGISSIGDFVQHIITISVENDVHRSVNHDAVTIILTFVDE